MAKWDDIATDDGKTYREVWGKGWQAGYDKAISLGRPFRGSDFPEGFQHRGGTFWNGYAEGVLSASSKIKKK